MPSMRFTRRSSPGEKSVSLESRRVRVLGFFSRRCERFCCRRLRRPVPVIFTRFAAPRSVFILGISRLLLPRRATNRLGGRLLLAGLARRLLLVAVSLRTLSRGCLPGSFVGR